MPWAGSYFCRAIEALAWGKHMTAQRKLSVVSRLACKIVQPMLSRVVRRVAAQHPSLFARLGPHQSTDFLIDPVELPFALHLRPDPNALLFRAVPRDAAPQPGEMIRGKFLLLLELMDAEEDGDAAFFSRNFPGLNFTPEELEEAVTYAHAKGTKVLLALNTYPPAGKVDLWRHAADIGAKFGVDAFIVVDMGVAGYIARTHPSVRLHRSV